MRRHNVSRRGFTLVEIMVVLGILVLLAVMVGPRVLKLGENADKKATLTQIKAIEKALKFYKADTRHYPSTEEGLQALIDQPQAQEQQLVQNWSGPYLDEDALPVDPWNSPYRYEFPPTRGKSKDKPNIWSLGPDGQDQTEDDIVNWTPGDGEGGDTESASSDSLASNR